MIAEKASLGDITESALIKSIAQFKKEVNIIKTAFRLQDEKLPQLLYPFCGTKISLSRRENFTAQLFHFFEEKISLKKGLITQAFLIMSPSKISKGAFILNIILGWGADSISFPFSSVIFSMVKVLPTLPGEITSTASP